MKKLLTTFALVLFTIITIVAQTYIIEDVQDVRSGKWQDETGEIKFTSLGIELIFIGKTLYFTITGRDNSNLAPIIYAKCQGQPAKFTVVRDKGKISIVWEALGDVFLFKCREKKQ